MNSEVLMSLQLELEDHLAEIEQLLPNYNLTLIANYAGNKDLKNADIVLTRSTREKIISALDHLEIK